MFIRRIIEGVHVKYLEVTLLFIDFSKAFDSILLGYGLAKETVAAIMMIYKNSKALVRSPDGDTNSFNIITGVL